MEQETNGILMEETQKYFFREEDFAERFIESQKELEGDLIDYKLSKKENQKDGEYFIVTIKRRFKTLAEAKESL